MPDAAFTEHEKARVRELHAQGMGRNAISRETGIHPRRVSNIAASLGLTFSRAGATAAATEAKKADAAERRARLQVNALEAAETLLEQMFRPAHAFNFGGKDNTYAETTLNQPTFADQRAIAGAIQALVTSSTRLAEFDLARATGVDDGKSMLGALAQGLGDAYRQLQEAEAAADAAGS